MDIVWGGIRGVRRFRGMLGRVGCIFVRVGFGVGLVVWLGSEVGDSRER